MMIYEALDISLEKKEIISLVGAGGKTTLIDELAKELKSFNKRVLSTTSTQTFQLENPDYFLLEEIKDDFKAEKGTITSYGNHVKDGKLIGSSLEKIEDIIKRNIFDYVLIEADGSKRKPLKAPADHEPLVSNLTTITIGVVGLDSIGQELNDSNFHRAERIANIVKKEIGEKIDRQDIISLLVDNEGTFKGSVARKILLLNKADSPSRIRVGRDIKEQLLLCGIIKDVLISNIKTKEFF